MKKVPFQRTETGATCEAWAIKWREENLTGGKREMLLGRFARHESVPDFVAGYRVMTFTTRQQARDYVERHYGHIRNRKDLQSEPHGWKMPQVVKIKITVEEL